MRASVPGGESAMKWMLGVLVVALAGALAWRFIAAGDLKHLPSSLRSAAITAVTPGSDAGLRKCLLDGKTVYTNEACPAGSREQAVSGGSLSVLPAAPAPPGAAAQGPAPVGHARDLLLKPDKPAEPDLKAKRIDAIVNP